MDPLSPNRAIISYFISFCSASSRVTYNKHGSETTLAFGGLQHLTSQLQLHIPITRQFANTGTTAKGSSVKPKLSLPLSFWTLNLPRMEVSSRSSSLSLPRCSLPTLSLHKQVAIGVGEVARREPVVLVLRASTTSSARSSTRGTGSARNRNRTNIVHTHATYMPTLSFFNFLTFYRLNNTRGILDESAGSHLLHNLTGGTLNT